MSVKLLTENHFEILSLIGRCTGSYESTLVTMPHCWKSLVAAHLSYNLNWFILLPDKMCTMLCWNVKQCKPPKDFFFKSRLIWVSQGCGNTMPELSDLVPFHTGQVENFYLLVLGQVQVYKVNKILYFIF